MAKRMVLMVVVILALLGGLGFVKFKQVEAAIEQGKNFKIPPTAVTTVVAKKETWPSTLGVIGTMAAVQGVTVSADLPGIVDKIHFESGQWVKAGRHSGGTRHAPGKSPAGELWKLRAIWPHQLWPTQELVKQGVSGQERLRYRRLQPKGERRAGGRG